MKNRTFASALYLVLFAWCVIGTCAESRFDAAPFGLPLPEGDGIVWEDLREIHEVKVHFAGKVPAPETVSLEYWGSRWPEQHLPKDREPGGGSVGWMELGNWYNGGWRGADAQVEAEGDGLRFTFRPVNAKEFPMLKDYLAAFRYTLKLRLRASGDLPKIEKIEVFTDSKLTERSARLAFADAGGGAPKIAVFNGTLNGVEGSGRGAFTVSLNAVTNSDPNTFDRTIVTVTRGKVTFSFSLNDLKQGALYLPRYGAAVLGEGDERTFDEVRAVQGADQGKSLYDRVALLPEQTWQSSSAGMPPKKSRIYFPMGLDGGRQRFRVNADGSIQFRSNDGYLKSRPGKDTPRLDLEPAQVRFGFGLPGEPESRWLEDSALPVCHSRWRTNGVVITGTSFVTELGGIKAEGAVPEPDSFAVFMVKYVFSNASPRAASSALAIRYNAGNSGQRLRRDEKGFLWLGEQTLRGQVVSDDLGAGASDDSVNINFSLAPGETTTVICKFPYVPLTEKAEHELLSQLEFETERLAVAGYWRRRQNESTRLITPEPVLNDFYRAHAGHLLINCEREPKAARRFARVGSFSYGAYGNESCMMVVDLDRRGYHQEARECLDAWLHYQGTVKLPGDFASKEGILYGAGGYEAGGYNQHHGWILWCLAEHYKFTRDTNWLRSATGGILAGADWIIRETQRTADRHPLERGLLPAGSLEDIGDWWTWLSTSCYTWRGLDAAAWTLEQLGHPGAKRVRAEADAYHSSLLANFRKAAQLSPVVRLRDGTAVSKIPSHVHRRGRSFGWICETLEGALHLIITGAIDPNSDEAESILKDYEDNLYLSNQYGYTLENFDKQWFSRGGMSMQACLLLDAEPYLYRDDVKHALRAIFNGIAVSHFPDVHMNTEHALPDLDDWAGDHFKSSDEANACGWLRYLFVRESGDTLLLGQAVPRDWLREGQRCGVDRAATYFGPITLTYAGEKDQIIARLDGPYRNPPRAIRLRFRAPGERPLKQVTANGEPWKKVQGDWVELPGNVGRVEVIGKM